MGSIDDERLSEVDRLLQELLPGEDGHDEGGARSHPPETVIVESGPARSVHARPRPSRRNGVFAAAVCLAIVAAGGIAYLVASDRTSETTGPVGDGLGAPTTTALAGTLADRDADGEPVEAGAGEEPVASEEAIEVLGTRLKAVDLSSIEFVTGTNQLTERGRSAIAEVAALLVATPAVPTQVQVATFSQATPGENHGLSTQQAQTIVEALIAGGVSPARLAFTGHGSEAQGLLGDDGVLLFETDDADLANELAGLNHTVAALGEQGSLTPQVLENLDLVADAMIEHSSSSVTLIAHADGGSAAASHDLSHLILDEAVANLTDLGVASSRLSTVGMGPAPIDIERDTIVDIAVGSSASMAVAMAQIDTDRIGFEFGSNVLTSDGRNVLTQVASALTIDPSVQIDVSAHSYTEATSQENHDLSHGQGDAVVDVLVEAGVARSRLTVTGHGDPPQFAEPGRESLIRFDPVGP